MQLRTRLHPPAPLTALPAAPLCREYNSPAHGGRLVELEWTAAEAAAEAAAALLPEPLLPWFDPLELDALPAHLGVILTYLDHQGAWLPATVVTESAVCPGEWGLFAARRLNGSALVGTMCDAAPLGITRPGSAHAAALVAAAGGQHARFLFESPVSGRRVQLYDGAACRPGGPRAANDPRGTGRHANCELWEPYHLYTRPHVTIEPLRPNLSPSQRRSRELLWHYGSAYWEPRA